MMALLPAKTTVGFSNMRGPVKRVMLGGYPVEKMYNGGGAGGGGARGGRGVWPPRAVLPRGGGRRAGPPCNPATLQPTHSPPRPPLSPRAPLQASSPARLAAS
jgi:hypothetical protein